MDATTRKRMVTSGKTDDPCAKHETVARSLRFPAAPSDDGSTFLSRPAMPNRATAPQFLRHTMPRGVYSEPYGTGRVYFTVQSNGVRGTWRFQLDTETEDDVIEALADVLDQNDPQPLRVVRPPYASPAVERALHLHRA